AENQKPAGLMQSKRGMLTCFHLKITTYLHGMGLLVKLCQIGGQQFTSQEMTSLCKTWGVIQRFTTSYHPQANRTERSNQTIKTMIAEFRFAINAAQHETTGRSLAELMLGRCLKGPLECLIGVASSPHQPYYKRIERQTEMNEQVRQRIGVRQPRQARYYNARRRGVQLLQVDLVWVRSHPMSKASENFSSKLAPKWSGPATVVRQVGPITYVVQWNDQKQKVDTVNVVNLKPYPPPPPFIELNCHSQDRKQM
uniref:Tf2-1-like SH3-like domain-containing protein n=1 Tax=Oryzias latipes TaxID=8090 RepID=A0A3P9LL15_ORYLA